MPPAVRPDAFSIDLVRAHGSYKAGRNAAEIVRVVAAAVDFMIRNAELPPDEMQTLGIAALGREQRDAICDEFNRMARLSAVERYLAACNLATATRDAEPFFVKDIENLEGDSRDVLMISLTCGREPGQPRLAQRFGAISAATGQARQHPVDAGAAPHRAVRLDRSGRCRGHSRERRRRAGARRLSALRRGPPSQIAAQSGDRGRGRRGGASDADNCRREIAARLEAHGFSADLAGGAFGVELAVRHPRDAGLYLASIASDGPELRRRGSARERDRLRDAVLSARGWTCCGHGPPTGSRTRMAQTAKLVEDLTGLAANPIEVDKAHRHHRSSRHPRRSTAPPTNASGGGDPAAAKPLTPQGASP